MPPPLPGWREAKRDGAEELAVRAACGQVDANAREVLDHARADLDQMLAEGIELSLASGCVRGTALRTASISQYAAVWSTSRT
jgi:hypothetical protein